MGISLTEYSGRKIRDRIAKLQERVIANELRAAAPLNGWGQQFTPTPSTPTFHTSIHDHDRDINFLKSLLSMTTDSTMSFLPSCNLSPASSWSSDMTVPLSPTFMPGDSPCFPTESNDFPDITSSTIPNSSLRRDIDISPSTYSNMFDTNAFQGLSDTGASFFSDRFNTTANQPLCYAATGTHSCLFVLRINNLVPDVHPRSYLATYYPSAQQHVTPIQDHRPRPSGPYLSLHSGRHLFDTNIKWN